MMLRKSKPSHEKRRKTYNLEYLVQDLESKDLNIYSLQWMLHQFGWDNSTVEIEGKRIKLLPKLIELNALRAAKILVDETCVELEDCTEALFMICRDPTTAPDAKLALLQSLLYHGTHCEMKDHDSNTPLHLAYSSNASARFLAEIALYTNVNILNGDGDSVLHVALRADDATVLNLLLYNGADPNLLDGRQQHPLILAARCRNDKCLRLLLHYGANVDLVDVNCRDALPLLRSPVMARALLLRYDMDVNTQDEDGVAILHTAFASWCEWATIKEQERHLVDSSDESLADLFLTKAIDINLKDSHGRTPLHYACRIRHTLGPRFVKALVSKGADVSARDDMGWTPLHVATAHGNYKTAITLIDEGANVLALDNLERSALHVIDQLRDGPEADNASASSGVTLVDSFLRHDFDFWTLDGNGALPFVSVRSESVRFAMVLAAASRGNLRP